MGMKKKSPAIWVILFIIALATPTIAKSYNANSHGLDQEGLVNYQGTDLDKLSLNNEVLKQVNNRSNRKAQNIITSEDAASRKVLNTGVIRKKIQSLEKQGARIGTMVDISSTEKGAKYYLVQLQEIKPERNVTIDTFCVYRSGVVDWFDYLKDRCVKLANYR